MPTLAFSIQQIGNYSYLSLEGVLLSSGPGFSLGPPPLSEPLTGSPAISIAKVRGDAEQAAAVASNAWGRGWFLQLWNALQRAGITGGGVSVTIEAPSIDETDIGWYASLTADPGTANPVTFTPTMVGTSRYGRQFAIGDYALIADSATVGLGTSQRYRYEIVQITALAENGPWSVNRAQFGTPLVAHPMPAAGQIPIYRLIDKFWLIPMASATAPQPLKLPWDSMCIPALQAYIAGITLPSPQSLIPAVSATDPAAPGLRTLSGSEYTLGMPGTIALASTSVLRLSVAGWHSIRNIFFEFDGAAGSGVGAAGDTAIALAYINAARTAAYLIGRYTIANGSRVSYPSAPQNRRIPYSGTWPFHSGLPRMTGALDANGKLQNGFVVDPLSTAAIEEDGELDFIVTACATTPGSGLRGTIQT